MSEFKEPEQQQSDLELTLEELESKYCLLDGTSIKIYKGENENYDVHFGFCEDCKFLNKLQWTSACADGYNCCMKLICHDECAVYCSAGHINYYYNCGDSITLECEICKESINPHCTWWGLSIEEHDRRYG